MHSNCPYGPFQPTASALPLFRAQKKIDGYRYASFVKQAMLEGMQQLLGEVRTSEAQKRKAADTLRAEIAAANNRIEGGPGWTPEQEVRGVMRGRCCCCCCWRTLDFHLVDIDPLHCCIAHDEYYYGGS